MTATTVPSASLEPVTISEICSPAEVSARPASNTHMAPSPKEITAAMVTCLGGPGCWAYGFGSPPYGPGRSPYEPARSPYGGEPGDCGPGPDGPPAEPNTPWYGPGRSSVGSLPCCSVIS